MAASGLKNFKEIVQNKAYRVNPNDRKIFEEGDLQSFFGLSEDDLIEFIIYDSSENQLPQKGFGNVRYIPLTTDNINDYILISEGTVMTKNNLPSEFFVDVERLIKEAGYANGVFKTQISLINKRLGSYKEKDKVWIGEISPSRTEVRLFPLQTSPNADDLRKRFNIFYTNGDFKSDIIYNIFKMIERTSPSIIVDTLKNSYGESFYNKLKSEYKIGSFDVLATNIHKKFIESAQYEFTNRVSNLKDPNYGRPKKTTPPLQLSEDTIMELLNILTVNAINFYLAPRDEQLSAQSKKVLDSSLDNPTDVLQTKKSDIQIDTRPPEQKVVYVEKPEITDVQLEFKRKLKKELQLDPDPITKDMPNPPADVPVIKTPVEKENPKTGDIIQYHDDIIKIFHPAEETPVIVETPIKQDIPTLQLGGGPIGGGGGRGSSVQMDIRDNPIGNDYKYFSREQIIAQE